MDRGQDDDDEEGDMFFLMVLSNSTRRGQENPRYMNTNKVVDVHVVAAVACEFFVHGEGHRFGKNHHRYRHLCLVNVGILCFI